MSRRGSRRSGQSMVEMAMIAPILIMLLMATIDFGRAAYVYATLAGAAREGARTAALTGSNRPSNVIVVGTVQQYGVGLSLSGGSCVNGQSGASFTPSPALGNTGYIYVTGPTAAAAYNAPAGEPAAGASGSCLAVVPAYAAHAPLTVTVEYNFQPLTPLAAQFLPSGIVMAVSSTMTTEY